LGLDHCIGYPIGTALQQQGVAPRSLTEQTDTTTPHGAFLFSVFGALAQYERALTTQKQLGHRQVAYAMQYARATTEELGRVLDGR
jgi:DNA invertase Pin-like site-specific DNA recombinase